MIGQSAAYKEKLHLAEMINDASIDRIFAINTSYQIISWNKTNEQVTGLNREDVLGKDIFEVLPQLNDSDEYKKAMKYAFRGFNVFVPANKGAYDSGYYENHFIPLKDDLDNVIGILNIGHNVAHRIKAENELAALNKALEQKNKELKMRNAELASFTHVASHDLKEPLRKVQNFLNMIMANESEHMSPHGKLYFERIQAALHRIDLLTNDIGTFAGLETEFAQISDIDLNNLLKYVISGLSKTIEQKQARINIHKLPVIKGYRHQLSEMFRCIIGNALKFQDPHRKPVIEVSKTTISGSDISHINAKEDTDYNKISIVDNGIGFDNKHADRLFQMFFKLTPDGEDESTGIGLTISKKIAEIHHGFIIAHSRPGEGSTFDIYLPVQSQK